MSSSYPGSLDNFSTSHADGVNETIHASTVNDLADAVNKIESTLGANPVLTSNFSKVRKVTSSTTAASTDYQILADATSAGVVVTLPAASSNSGLNLHIHKIDSSNAHTVTVTPAGTDTIEGVTGNYVLRRPAASIALVSDGASNWKRVDQVAPVAQQVFYVDANSGNDSYSGMTPSLAKKTIGAAITAAGSYSTIYVARGNYTETVDIGGLTNVKIVAAMLGGGTPTSLEGAMIIAPSASSSCLKASSVAIEVMMEGFGLVGSGNTYTGTLFDARDCSFSCEFKRLTLTGIPGDLNTAKQYIGPGSLGGTGILLNTQEQSMFDNIRISNVHTGILVGDGTSSVSKLRLSNIFFSQVWRPYVEVSGTAGGSLLCENWKTQNVFALTYAIAQLNSNGSNPADGDTVTVRDQTYRFKNTMALANDVKIGASIDATLLSLVKAVNQTGVVGTDYFTGTAAPTGVRAGWVNLVDYGASGGNGYTNNAVDTTHHACTFQVQDVIGPGGNAYTFTVTSANLSDYFGKGTFDRADWAVDLQFPNQYKNVDMMENISLPTGNCWRVACGRSVFDDCFTAPQTQMVLTSAANDNVFNRPTFQNAVTVQSGAHRNWFVKPYATADATVGPSSAQITDSGTGTVITLT